MTARRRLAPEERRTLLVEAGARLFAERAYDDVLMEDVATAAGVSRALLYRHFPGKRELFAAVYRQAAEHLLGHTVLTPGQPLAGQLAAGLDAHFDYFEANSHAVITANRTLAGDPAIQAIIAEELSELRQRILDAIGLTGVRRTLASSILMGWLTFVRIVTIDWLDTRPCPRAELREICIAALLGALEPLIAQEDSNTA
ncbi:TetR/AcrR family transcriptional regulator [Nocardia carnea]|uniref:TetR/AcrR family transcriptional regulator n=1 Tax=Nocardia carnea TaxID=37328 RepID=UPI002455E2FE|nr:helix-turn-helix domain-containing protein [Nocardia carnea]